MPLQNKEVFILKAQVEDDDGSSYASVLKNAGFNTKTIQILDFEYCNSELLKECLEKPSDYSGIIFTSPRSVKALVQCIGSPENLPSEWRKHNIFVVGEATKRILRNYLGLAGQCGITENAVGLAELIVQKNYDHPLLFPCSDMRRDTLPLLLTDKGVPFTEIKVYCTRQNPHLLEILNNITNCGTIFPEFVVFFSPSGVKYCLPILLQMNVPMDNVKIVAIGNTTLLALRELKVNVWSVSTSPSPQGVLNALIGGT